MSDTSTPVHDDVTTPNRHDSMEGFLAAAGQGKPNYAVSNSVWRALDALKSAETDVDLAVKVIVAVDNLERALATLRQRPANYR